MPGVSWNLDPHRNERVSEGLREELDELINYELTDPRVGPAAVSEVHVSPDFRRANVRLLLQGTPEKQFLRHQLAERLQLYHTPDLQFEPALPAALSAKAPQILKRIRRRSTKNTIS